MQVQISCSQVGGRTRAPPSKSYTHRAILSAGYAESATIHDPLISADTRATMRAVEALGGEIDRQAADSTDADTDGEEGVALDITGFDGDPSVPSDVIDCANSGTTMRLTTACAALADGSSVLTGDESLRSRPQGPLLDAIQQLGGRAQSTRGNGQAPLVVSGPVTGGAVSIPGDVSSQYITALLMMGAVTGDGIEIELKTKLKSAPYVDITIEVLDAFGVDARATTNGFSVAGGQQYSPAKREYHVPGDFSSISYLLAAGAVAAEDGQAVVVEGARPSAQGDTAIVDILERMGARIDWDRESGEITVHRSDLEGVEVDVGNTPDLLPTIATLGAVADGKTRITNAEHVRYKETDRVNAMAEELQKLGAEVTERRDELLLYGAESDLTGGRVQGRADHRIVMALAVAGLVARGTTVLEGGEHVDVSFPAFFDTLYHLGADIITQ